MLHLKKEASSEQLEKFNINESCFVIELNKVIEERCDELDYELDEAGHEILHREYIRVATSIYDYFVFFK